MSDTFNGKTKWILTLFSVIILGLSAIISFAFASIKHNSNLISKTKDEYSKENSLIYQRLVRIETKLEYIIKEIKK